MPGRNFLPSSRQALLLVCVVLYHFAGYSAARLLSQGRAHFCFATPLDAAIPFLPWTIVIYCGCYLFWTVNYTIGTTRDTGNGHRFLLAHFIGESVCFLCFILLPSTMARAEITGTGLFEQLVALQYRMDAADNLLPSIHCFASWMSWLAVRRHPEIPGWYRAASLLMACAVCACTLTVKQHVLPDVFAGVLLAEISFRIAAKIEG